MYFKGQHHKKAGDKMKCCITCVRAYKKPLKFEATQAFVREMEKHGMPEELAEELLKTGKAVWSKEDVDKLTVFAAEIIHD